MSLPLGKSLLFWSIVFTVMLHTWSSVMLSQISDRLTSCSTACPGWDQKKHRNSLIRDVIICDIEIVFYSFVITVTQPERHDILNTQPLDCCLTACPCLWQRKHPHYLVGDVVICNTEMALLLQWRHMSVLMFPITSRSTVCSIEYPG